MNLVVLWAYYVEMDKIGTAIKKKANGVKGSLIITAMSAVYPSNGWSCMLGWPIACYTSIPN